MDSFPDDIFTEPEDVDPDTLANLGPLRRLAGVWQGRKGIDLNPKAAGPEQREYIERIEMQPIDPQANGPQLFYGLRYHIHIVASDEDSTFHDQIGYWLWEPATGLVMQTLTIPRGQATPDALELTVRADRGGPGYGICSTDFLEQAFRTDAYRCDITFNDDGSWTYLIQTELFVRGAPFNHRDTNTLKLVAPPKLNPLALIVNDRATGNEKGNEPAA